MDIKLIIKETIEQINGLDSTNHYNERYLHHYFSKIVQDVCPISFSSDVGLHPEWATFIKKDREYARYLFNGQHYIPAEENGSAGFIDFAIGKAERPKYAIEFKLSRKLNQEGVIFDYMKLFDKRSPFSEVFSVIVYYGHKSESKLCKANILNQCIKEAQYRLSDLFVLRPHHFHVIEIIKGRVVNHLYSSDTLIFKNL